jgi:uncharacterized protein
LRIASDKPLAFVVARLCDVAPDGSSVRIAHGMLNLCHRDGMEHPMDMPLEQAVEVSFALDQMAYRLDAGHRLRLAISNSYWPFVWPSPAAGRLRLTGGSLELPCHAPSVEEWLPPPAEGAKRWNHKVVREGKTTRRIEQDLIGGGFALIVKDDLGDAVNLDHGLCTGETMSELWQIHPDDPLSARAEHNWEQRLSRGDWSVKTVAWAEMTASATEFRLQASLKAYEGEALIFERHFDDKVKRRFI